MRKRLFVIAVTTAAVMAGSGFSREAFGDNPPPSISIQEMHRQVDTASLPVTVVAEPF